LRSGFSLDSDVMDRFDVIGLDVRGVGESERLECPRPLDELFTLDLAPDDAAEQAGLETLVQGLVDGCADEPLLPFMGTDQVVQDIEQLRLAMGGEPLTFFGLSYGTALGLGYAEAHPEAVRAMVLDGVVDPALDGLQFVVQEAGSFENALRGFFSFCDYDLQCPLEGGARGALDALAAQLEEAPLDVFGRAAPLGPGDMLAATVAAMYDASAWADLARSIADALEGDGERLARYSDVLLSRTATGEYHFNWDAFYAISCADIPFPQGLAYDDLVNVAVSSGARLGAWFAYRHLPCAFWPVESTREPHEIIAEGSGPVLVLGNRGDPATPYDWATRVARTLANGQLLTVDGAAHTSYFTGHECAAAAVDEFLISGELPEAQVVC
jgi:pimeloyl-ACP methyl ester carboxylesterase